MIRLLKMIEMKIKLKKNFRQTLRFMEIKNYSKVIKIKIIKFLDCE